MEEIPDIIQLLSEKTKRDEVLPETVRTLSESDMRLLADEIGKALVKILVDAGVLARC